MDIKKTPEAALPPEFVSYCRSVTAKRAKTVIDHILAHGIITNEDLSDIYGYDHPPRAIRDVRESGIPIITHKVPNPKTGRQIGAYTFGDPSDVKEGRFGGRRAFSKQFKKALVLRYGVREAFTREALNERYLQIDHRVPYQIAGNGNSASVEDYMLIDASSQRAKSWSCESCPNLLGERNSVICKTCFWASPESYDHVATIAKRRLDVVWTDAEIEDYERAQLVSQAEGVSLQDFIKRLLRK